MNYEAERPKNEISSIELTSLPKIEFCSPGTFHAINKKTKGIKVEFPEFPKTLPDPSPIEEIESTMQEYTEALIKVHRLKQESIDANLNHIEAQKQLSLIKDRVRYL